MKLRSKLLVGIGSVIILLTIVAGTGFYGIKEMSRNISDLGYWSNIDMVMNEGVIQKFLIMGEVTTAFRDTPSNKNYSVFQDAYKDTQVGLEEWISLVANEPELKTIAVKARENLTNYAGFLERYQKLAQQKIELKKVNDSQVTRLLNQLEESMVQQIDPAKERAESSENIPQMVQWGAIDMVMNEAVIANALKLQTFLQDYYYTRTAESYSALTQQLSELQAGVGEWQETLSGAGDIENIGLEVSKSIQSFSEEFAAIRDIDLNGVALTEQTDANTNQVYAMLEEGMESIIDPAKEATLEIAASSEKRNSWEIIIISLIAISGALAGGLIFSGRLVRPLKQTVEMMTDLQNGNLDTRLNLTSQDEIGQMARTLDSFAENLKDEVLEAFERLANGDLTFTAQGLIKEPLAKANDALNDVMAQIQVAGDEITSASGEIADASQSLSQGATESAASLEEISASLNQTSSQTTVNAENATQASSLSTETKLAAEKGSAQMQNMVAAMADINEAGQNISKIIKTIDEIAFQTNLLALNAAVEAARAGQHGKGFAVVAEEVRNLAARSAKAAAETSELIEGSVAKTENGSVIANQTAEALQEIVSGIGKVTDLVAEIAAASKEQAQGVAEINMGVTQIDTVTQQNTASAEESAAAAEELSAQAAQLRNMLQRFTLKQEQKTRADSPQNRDAGWKSVENKQNIVPIRPPAQINLDDTNFGRY